MRISCHLLPIESGHYKKIPRVERLCPLCNRSEIGDEFHYSLKCTHSSLSHIRGIFFESLYSINSNFTNMSCKALFSYIISMCDENIINLIINLSPRNDPDPGVGIVSGQPAKTPFLYALRRWGRFVSPVFSQASLGSIQRLFHGWGSFRGLYRSKSISLLFLTLIQRAR